MATLSVQQIIRSGLKPTYATAATGGDEFVNDGVFTFFHAKNAATPAIAVTFVTQKTVDGQAVGDRTVSLPDGEERMVGPFPTDVYNNANGRVAVTYDAVASVTIAAIKMS